MNKKFHFITGLPRSGSTLLSSILMQNPKFHASITDSLAPMVKGVIEASQEGPGVKTEVPVERRKNIVKGLFNGFYEGYDKEVIFNTNRAWTYLTGPINEIYPDSKFLVCVRDINWILDSFEVAHRKHPFVTNTVTGGLGNSVYERVEALIESKGVVGFPYIGIKQAITGNEVHKLMLIEYENLCRIPESIMRAVYSFIDEPYYNHNYNDVEKSWDEYDQEIGIPMHRVRKNIEFIPRKSILPPDIQQKYSNMEVWRML